MKTAVFYALVFQYSLLCYSEILNKELIPGIGAVNISENNDDSKEINTRLIYPHEYDLSLINMKLEEAIRNNNNANSNIDDILRHGRAGNPIVYNEDNNGGLVPKPVQPPLLPNICRKWKGMCTCGETRLYCSRDPSNNRQSAEITLTAGDLSEQNTVYEFKDLDKLVIEDKVFDSLKGSAKIIRFEKIKDLVLEDKSLLFPQEIRPESTNEVEISFIECNISNIPKNSITQNIHTMKTVDDITSHRKLFIYLEFQRCNIEHIETGGIQNIRFSTLSIKETKIKSMDSECIYGTVYENLIVSQSELSLHYEKTIDLHVKETTYFADNKFITIGTRSIAIESFNAVIFKNNIVLEIATEALLYIIPAKDAIGANIVVQNNTIHYAESNALVINAKYGNIYRKMSDNKFNYECNCNITVVFQDLLDKDKVFDKELLTSQTHCLAEGNERYELISEHFEENCKTFPYLLESLAFLGVLLLIVIIIVSVVCCIRVKNMKEKESGCYSDCTSLRFSTLHSNAPLSPSFNNVGGGPGGHHWVVAVPEIKTYQETEVNFMFENAEPMTPPVSLPRYVQPPLAEFRKMSHSRISCPP